MRRRFIIRWCGIWGGLEWAEFFVRTDFRQPKAAWHVLSSTAFLLQRLVSCMGMRMGLLHSWEASVMIWRGDLFSSRADAVEMRGSLCTSVLSDDTLIDGMELVG